MESKIKSIEERLIEAEKDVKMAEDKASGLRLIRDKKNSLRSNFKNLMKYSDPEIKYLNSPHRYLRTSYGRESSLPLVKEDSALCVLYDVLENSALSHSIIGAVRQKAAYYTDRIWNRLATEQEYESIVNATEPFLGRYIQRVYDRKEKESADFQKMIDDEDEAYRLSQEKTSGGAKKEGPLAKKSFVERIRNILGDRR